jgi:hypothetical protein
MNNSRRKFLISSLLAAGAAVYGYEIAQAGNITNASSASGRMQHTVFFWLKGDASEEDRKSFEQGLKVLVGGIREVHKSEIGRPASTPSRDVVDNSFDYSLFTWFKSISQHDVYQAHPVHKTFIEKYGHLWERVVVHDSFLMD